MTEEQRKALLAAIIEYGVSGILCALSGLTVVNDFLQLPPNKREQAMKLLELAPKGTHQGGGLGIPQSPAPSKKQAS